MGVWEVCLWSQSARYLILQDTLCDCTALLAADFAWGRLLLVIVLWSSYFPCYEMLTPAPFVPAVGFIYRKFTFCQWPGTSGDCGQNSREAAGWVCVV